MLRLLAGPGALLGPRGAGGLQFTCCLQHPRRGWRQSILPGLSQGLGLGVGSSRAGLLCVHWVGVEQARPLTLVAPPPPCPSVCLPPLPLSLCVPAFCWT